MTHISRLIKDRRGVTTVEFALIAPLMFAIYAGVNTLARDINVVQKVDFTAQSLASLVAQKMDGGSSGGSGFNETEINDVFAAATPLMAPFPANQLKMTISEVTISDTDWTAPNVSRYTGWQAVTTWSIARNGGSLRSCGQPGKAPERVRLTAGTIPKSFTETTNGVDPSYGDIVIVDVTYQYALPLNLGMRTISRTAFAQNRNLGSKIEYNMTSGVRCSSS